jgi:hypothetical protein
MVRNVFRRLERLETRAAAATKKWSYSARNIERAENSSRYWSINAHQKRLDPGSGSGFRRLLSVITIAGAYMPAFCARWPDGSFSIVDAEDQTEALIQLDEIGDEPADLWQMQSCLLDF